MPGAYWQNTNSSERLTRHEDVQPVRDVTFAEAQPLVNFVVFEPTWLPYDCEIARITLRPEQPPGRPGIEAESIGQTPWSEANPTSIRAMIEGNQRTLRIKEFLYDWAVPAASTAPLWKSPTLTPFTCSGAVGWIGTDYSKRHGACVQLDQSQIEFSVYDGEFSDEELMRIMRSLQQTDMQSAAVVQSAPFFELNYWVRYKVFGPDVPYGLWDYSAHRRYQHSRLVALDELSDLAVPIVAPTDQRWEFNSAVAIDSPAENHHDVEIIYRNTANNNDYLWLIAMNADSSIAPTLPPTLAGHPTKVHGKRKAGNRSIWYAAVDPTYGAWEAFWREADAIYMAFAHSSLELTEADFLETIGNLHSL